MVTYLLASSLVAALAVLAALTGALIWQLQRGGKTGDKLLALTEDSAETVIEHDKAVAAAGTLEKQNKRLRNALRTAEEMVEDCTDVDQLPDLLDQLQKLREEMSGPTNESGNGGEDVYDPATGTS